MGVARMHVPLFVPPDEYHHWFVSVPAKGRLPSRPRVLDQPPSLPTSPGTSSPKTDPPLSSHAARPPLILHVSLLLPRGEFCRLSCARAVEPTF
jgi:hypothetical protein